MSAPGGTTPCSPVIARYADYLRAYYRTAPIAPDNKLTLTQAKTYVNLALVMKEKVSQAQADRFTKATHHGQIDEVYQRKQPVSLEDVLKPEEGQDDVKCVLVEGAPGVCKSTFAWELCRRSNEIEAMRKYSLVVLLRLRENRVQQASTIADLFYHSETSFQQAVAEEVSAGVGAQIVLVLDGFDEVSESFRNNPFLVNLLRGVCLPKATVVVTSRPSARAQLLSLCSRQVSKHIMVLGFLQDQIRQYARSTFGHVKSCQELLES